MRRAQFFPGEINRLGYRIGAEVGVYEGIFSEVILRDSLIEKLYSVDLWVDMAGEQMTHIMGLCKARLAPYGARSEMIQADSVTASGKFADGSLDIVYIDADHSYEGCTSDLTAWWPKIRIGGMFAGHDYKNHNRNLQPMGNGLALKGSKRVLDAVTDFTNGTGITVNHTRKERSPSWWFIKA